MSLPTVIFLTLAISAFALFGVVLFSVHLWVNLPARPGAKRTAGAEKEGGRPAARVAGAQP